MDFDFGVVDKLDNVPEQFRSLYSEKDGKFAPGESFNGIVEAFRGLNKALGAARNDAKKKPTIDLSILSDFGDSPERIKETVTAKIKSLEDQLASGAKINVDKIKADLAAAHLGELTKRDKRIEALTGQLYTVLVENVATAALVDAKGVPELLLPHLKKSIKVVEQDGKQSVCVVDAQGDLRYSSVTGQPMSIKELVAEMKANKTFARGFDSEAPSGGGFDPSGGKRPAPRTGQPRTSHDKIAAGISKGVPRGT